MTLTNEQKQEIQKIVKEEIDKKFTKRIEEIFGKSVSQLRNFIVKNIK